MSEEISISWGANRGIGPTKIRKTFSNNGIQPFVSYENVARFIFQSANEKPDCRWVVARVWSFGVGL